MFLRQTSVEVFRDGGSDTHLPLTYTHKQTKLQCMVPRTKNAPLKFLGIFKKNLTLISLALIFIAILQKTVKILKNFVINADKYY